MFLRFHLIAWTKLAQLNTFLVLFDLKQTKQVETIIQSIARYGWSL